jgi:restriction system protein
MAEGAAKVVHTRETFVTRETRAKAEPGGLTAHGALAGASHATSKATAVLTGPGVLAAASHATSTATAVLGALTAQGDDGVLEAVGIVGSSVVVRNTILTFGGNNTDGRIVEAVALPWFEIICLLEKDPGQAYQIPPRTWEEIVAGCYTKLGFSVTLTPHSGDLGRDVIVKKYIDGIGRIRVIDQVKAYKPGHLVTADSVRALVGVMPTDFATKCIVTTTSDFAPLVRTDRLIAPYIPSRLELVNGTELLAKLKSAAGKT